jgi:hypothetical protein
VPGGAEHGDALAVLDEQHCQRQGNHELQLRGPGEYGRGEDRGGQERSRSAGNELPADGHGQASCHQRAEDRGKELSQRRNGGQEEEGAHHRGGNGRIGLT